jgi:MFS family permease
MNSRGLALRFGTGSLAIYLRLSAMVFVDAAILACILPVLAIYMQHHHGFSARQMSLVYAMGPLAALVSPLIVGQLADRFFSAQRVLAVVNVLRSGCLVAAGMASSYSEFLVAMALVFLLQVPSLTLGAAVSFHHLKDSRHFGALRFWGSLSWILVVWSVSFYLDAFLPDLQARRSGNCFFFAAVLALVQGAYALTLPATPPAKGKNPLAVLDALYLLRDKSFLAIALGAFVMAAAMPFYMVLQGLFMVDPKNGLGISVADANRASTLAQSLELILFPMLALLLRRLGTRWVLFLGMMAWPLRFAAFMAGGPAWLVIGAQALHGFNVVFWMVSAVIAVDLLARDDVRASAQGLYAITHSGIGALTGQLLVGEIYGLAQLPDGGTDWTMVFLVPFCFTTLGALVFLFLYHESPRRENGLAFPVATNLAHLTPSPQSAAIQAQGTK